MPLKLFLILLCYSSIKLKTFVYCKGWTKRCRLRSVWRPLPKPKTTTCKDLKTCPEDCQESVKTNLSVFYLVFISLILPDVLLIHKYPKSCKEALSSNRVIVLRLMIKGEMWTSQDGRNFKSTFLIKSALTINKI